MHKQFIVMTVQTSFHFLHHKTNPSMVIKKKDNPYKYIVSHSLCLQYCWWRHNWLQKALCDITIVREHAKSDIKLIRYWFCLSALCSQYLAHVLNAMYTYLWLQTPLPLCCTPLFFVQVMVWCHRAPSHYLSQCCPRYILLCGVTEPLWVKMLDKSTRALLS